jgi:hypothetical protein
MNPASVSRSRRYPDAPILIGLLRLRATHRSFRLAQEAGNTPLRGGSRHAASPNARRTPTLSIRAAPGTRNRSMPQLEDQSVTGTAATGPCWSSHIGVAISSERRDARDHHWMSAASHPPAVASARRARCNRRVASSTRPTPAAITLRYDISPRMGGPTTSVERRRQKRCTETRRQHSDGAWDAGSPMSIEEAENTADNSTLYAPPLTLGLQRIGRDSPKSAALSTELRALRSQPDSIAAPPVTNSAQRQRGSPLAWRRLFDHLR